MQDSQEFIEDIFLSYNRILKRFKMFDVKTKNGKEITNVDLRQAVLIMLKKHPTCRWKNEMIKSKYCYILHEGYLLLMYVYFQNEKTQIDADIEFFKARIKEYEKILNVNAKNLFDKDIALQDLEQYFDRAKSTVKRAIYEMLKVDYNYRYIDNGKYIITKEGIEWLCKNCFKQKYLKLLEEYKMKLTEKYIEEDYVYDNFLNIN